MKFVAVDGCGVTVPSVWLVGLGHLYDLICMSIFGLIYRLSSEVLVSSLDLARAI